MRSGFFHKSPVALIVQEQILSETDHDVNIVPSVLINIDNRDRRFEAHRDGFKVLGGGHLFIGAVVVTQSPAMFGLRDQPPRSGVRQCPGHAVLKIFSGYFRFVVLFDQLPITHLILAFCSGPADLIGRIAFFPGFALSPDDGMKHDFSNVLVLVLRRKLALHDLQRGAINKIDSLGPFGS